MMNKNYVLNFDQLLFSALALKVTLQYILNTQIIKDGGIKFNITLGPMHLYRADTILLIILIPGGQCLLIVKMLLDCMEVISRITGLVQYNARQFITLLKVCGNVNCG